jgi:serine protease
MTHPAVSTLAPPAASSSERLAHQRRILAVREISIKQGALEAAAFTEEAVPDDAPIPHADDVFARIDTLMSRMPQNEIGDPVAFLEALKILHRHGDPALRKLADVRPGADDGVTPDDMSALEAVIIADGSRPSFLFKDGLLPANALQQVRSGRR